MRSRAWLSMEEDDSARKLWMGDLESYMDEQFLRACFAHFGFHILSVKWIKSPHTGMLARYCFVEFPDTATARHVLEQLTGHLIPGTNLKRFKLNWASRKIDAGQQEYNAFVADLSKDVTSQMLLEFFQVQYKSVRYAKVIEDEEGASKGYGFVRFTDEAERDLCIQRLDGTTGLGKRAITVKAALSPRLRELQSTMPPPPSAQTTGPYSHPATYTWPAYNHQFIPPSPLPSPDNFQQIVTEDIEEPPQDMNISAENKALYQHQEELFLQLQGARTACHSFNTPV